MAGDVVGGDVGCAGTAAAMVVVGLLGVPCGEPKHACVTGRYVGVEGVGAPVELTTLKVGVGEGEREAAELSGGGVGDEECLAVGAERFVVA